MLSSIYLPPVASIHIFIHTFIRFIAGRGNSQKVGLVKAINVEERRLTVCNFLRVVDVREYLEDDNHLLDEISLWPNDVSHPPFYLCDSDVVSGVEFISVRGYAFVFYGSNDIYPQLHRLINTFRVTSYFRSADLCLNHEKSFKSFPSKHLPDLLPACHPSAIFKQLISMKWKIQVKLNPVE